MAQYLSLLTGLLVTLMVVMARPDIPLVQWVEDGTPVCTATGGQYKPQPASNGAGGAIISWEDFRSGENDIYAQRMVASGTVQWNADGVAICTATGSQEQPQLVSDEAGGAIITWEDFRSGWPNCDIYAQRGDSLGTVQWTTNGVPICMAMGSQ